MTIIRNITLQDQSLPIAPPDDIYSGFFGIDSFHVILGKNGAGKTSILEEIAWQIGRNRGDADILIQTEGSGIRTMQENDRHAHGVIFYTGLPYRRRVQTSLRLIDASSDGKENVPWRNFEAFQEVTQALGVTASLIGTVSYTPNVFKEILIPSLVEIINEKKIQAIHPNLIQLGDKWLPELYQLSNDQNIENIEKYEINLRGIHTKFNLELREFFREFRRQEDLIVELSVLQDMASESGSKTKLGIYFFMSLGLLGVTNSDEYEKLNTRFRNAVEKTKWYMNQEGYEQPTYNRIVIKINSNQEANNILRSKTAINIQWSNLSSGMRALVDQFSRLHIALEKLSSHNIPNVLILIDEGDAYLHLDWQRSYVELLDKYLAYLKIQFSFNAMQVILTTHSPVIITDFPSRMVTNLDNGINPTKTFAAPLDEITLSSFGSNSIGSFAAKKINELHERIQNGKDDESDTALLEEIGDIFIKNALLRSRRTDKK